MQHVNFYNYTFLVESILRISPNVDVILAFVSSMRVITSLRYTARNQSGLGMVGSGGMF